MSREAREWAWAQKTGGGSCKAVLVALADHVNKDEDFCFPSQRRLSEHVETSERQVIRHLKRLVELKLISIDSRRKESGRQTSNLYRLHMTPVSLGQPSDASVTPDDQVTPTPPDVSAPGDTSVTLPPDTSVTPGDDIHDTPGTGTRTGTKEEAAAPAAPGPDVDEQPVTDAEHELARQCLAAFNSLAMDAYPLDDYLEMIVRCVRAHPDLGEPDHLAVIRSAFERPWWRGHPSPYVLWKTDTMFRRYVGDWRSEKSKPTTADYDAKTTVVTA